MFVSFFWKRVGHGFKHYLLWITEKHRAGVGLAIWKKRRKKVHGKRIFFLSLWEISCFFQCFLGKVEKQDFVVQIKMSILHETEDKVDEAIMPCSTIGIGELHKTKHIVCKRKWGKLLSKAMMDID